jgi:hypothetical protein
MTQTFETIMLQKKASIRKVMDGLQELTGQPVFTPPDADLRKCSSPELVYLIALKAQVDALEAHSKQVMATIFGETGRLESLKATMKELGKCDDSKGGASFGW